MSTGRRTRIDDAARDVGDVRSDRGSGRVAARARTHQRQRTDGVAVDHDGVEHAHCLGQRFGLGDHGGVHALFDAVLGPFGDAEQLDPEPEFVGGGEIGERNRLDALDGNRRGVDARAEGERGENGELVSGVETADVECRVGLGIAELLRLGEAGLERQPLGLHSGEDVIAGAVQNSANPTHRVAGEPLAQRLDDGNAAADGRLEGERGTLDFGQPRQLHAMRGEHRLVGGDDGQPALEGRRDGLIGRAVGAADQFDKEIDLAFLGEFDRIGEKVDLVRPEPAVAIRARADRRDVDIAACALVEIGPKPLQQARQRAADHADSGDADS